MRFRLVATIALIVATAAAGCTSGDGSSSKSPSASSPPPSSSSVPPTPASTPPTSASIATTGPNVRPGEKLPVLAAVGETNTRAGSAVFASYWMQSLDWAYATTDGSLARSLIAASCTDCSRFIRVSIDDIVAKGEHFRGGRISVRATAIASNDHRRGATAAVDVTVSQAALQLIGHNGRLIENSPAISSAVFRTWLQRRGDRWIVVDWKEAVRK